MTVKSTALWIGGEPDQSYEPDSKYRVVEVSVQHSMANMVGYTIEITRVVGKKDLGGVWGKTRVKRVKEYRIKSNNGSLRVPSLSRLDRVITKLLQKGEAYLVDLDSSFGYAAAIY